MIILIYVEKEKEKKDVHKTLFMQLKLDFTLPEGYISKLATSKRATVNVKCQ